MHTCLVRRFSARIVLASLCPLLVLPGLVSGGESRAEKAETLYEAAKSAYNSGRHAQAVELFEQFTRIYGKSEKTPAAHLRGAYSALNAKDYEAFETFIDGCIRRYRHSPEWFCAWGAKLHRRREEDKPEQYIDDFEDFARQARPLPLELQSFDAKSWRGFDWDYQLEYADHVWDLGAAPSGERWPMSLIWATAKQPELAKRALRALQQTFRHYGTELPPDWQYTHYRLLMATGEDADEATEVLKEYVEAWGDDMRGVRLQLMVLRAAKRGDVEYRAAEATWKKLLEEYVRYASMTGWLRDFLHDLRDAKDFASYAELVEAYLQRPDTELRYHNRRHYRDDALDDLVSLARSKPSDGEPSRPERALAILRKLPEYEPHDRRERLEHMIDLLGRAGENDEAIKAFRTYLDEHWGIDAYEWSRRATRNDEALKAVLKEVCKAKGAGEIDEESEAGKALATVEQRLKDDRDRIAGEEADRMLAKYASDPATPVAVYKVAEYYYQRLLPEQRDKWAEKMFRKFPSHPLTDKVLRMQASAAKKDERPKVAAMWLDRIAKSFPGGRGRHWIYDRLWCEEAQNDAKGKWKQIQDYYGPMAKAGFLEARRRLDIGELEQTDLPEEKADARTKRGAYWMAKGKEVKGTLLESEYYRRAYQAYFNHWSREQSDYDGAADAVEALLEQDVDPEMKWKLAYEEVNLLVHEGKGLDAADQLLKLLPAGGKQFDLSQRVHLPGLGGTMGTLTEREKAMEGIAKKRKIIERARKGMEVANRLKPLIFTLRDRMAAEYMLGNLYRNLDGDRRAVKHYYAIIDAAPYAGQAFEVFNDAFGVITDRDNNMDAQRETMQYIRKIPMCQSLVPELLYRLARHLLRRKDRSFLGVSRQLSSRYPHSGKLIELAKDVARAEKRQRERNDP
jgi:outer membrane protein assembly factor BamD (BamD/ComL family)